MKKIKNKSSNKIGSKSDNCVMISSFSGKAVSESEVQAVDTIVNRHASADENDIFGRTDIGLSRHAINQINKQLWPEVQIKKNLMVINEHSGMSIIRSYISLNDNMMREYADFMIQNNIMKSPDSLSDYPIIDMCGFITAKDNKCAAQSSAPLDLTFSKEDIELLYLSGKKVFTPRFDKFFVRLNKNLYSFINAKKNDKTNSITFDIETYAGNKDFWMLTYHYKTELIFTDSNTLCLPCEINILSETAYEQILTQYISEMNWNAKYIQFWCDMFRVPKTLDQLTVASLRNESAAEPDKTETHFILYDPAEIRIMKKIYGNYFSTYSDTQSAINNIVRVNKIPELIKTLSKIYVHMYAYAKPVKITKTPDGRFNQNFGRINIISHELYFQK